MIQTQKHTPGPWRVCQNGIKEMIYAGDHLLMKAPGETIGEIEANARLIAAAPETAAERDRLKALNVELLAALKACEEYMTACGYFAPWKGLATQVRAAIAKTEGR